MPTTARVAIMIALALCLSGVESAWARVKLITLPVRERVAVHMEHADVTLVEEERLVPLTPGGNTVDFSWSNTGIDPESIVLRIIEGSGSEGVEVLSVSYPPNENALIWRVHAKKGGTARVRIAYTLAGLTGQADYRAVASPDEKHLLLTEYLDVTNRARESFDNAVAHYAPGRSQRLDLGRSETKRIRVAAYRQVPVSKIYTADLAEYGYQDRPRKRLKVPMHYRFKNSQDQGLGSYPLRPGKMRIFQDDGKGSQAFLGEDRAPFTPLGNDVELYLGVARDVVVTRIIEKNTPKRLDGNLFDHDVVIRYEIENFKNQPVTLLIAEDVRRIRDEVRGNNRRDVEWEIGPETSLPGDPDQEKGSYRKVVYSIDLAGRSAAVKVAKRIYRLHLRFKNEWR
ncbi:MAG: hypothetical protein HQL50_04935 [Magnetococcales bacterium]|nr:hypothetical protein [Magnetococcales bacterium]